MSRELPLNLEAIIKEINLNNNINNNKTNSCNNDNNNSYKRTDEMKKENAFSKQLSLVNGFRILLICVCLFWFSYNAYVIIHKYLLFDTIITLQMVPPDVSDLPGLTVCGPYVIPPYTLRELDDKYNYTVKLKESDGYDSSEMNINRKNFDHHEQKAFEKYSAIDIIEKYSLKPEKLLAKCVFNGNNLRHDSDVDSTLNGIECTDIAPIVESIYEGRKCFTYFSRLSNFSEYYRDIKMEYVMNPNIEVTVRMTDNLWAFSSYDYQVIMTVHPPGIIPTHLDFEYFRVIKQFYYDVYFTKKSSFLKKKPWKTGCKDYDEDDKYKMREDCVNDCIKRLSTSEHNCVNYYGVLTKNLFDETDKFCLKQFQNYTTYVEARRTCQNQCPPECVQVIYEIQGNVNDIEDLRSCVNEEDSGCNATISVKIHHSPFTFINHTEALSTEEFIGTIGGHMGIWLGLSAIALFDLVLTFIERVKMKFRTK